MVGEAEMYARLGLFERCYDDVAIVTMRRNGSPN